MVMKNTFKLYFFFGMLCLSSTSSLAQSNSWKLVYENDLLGETIQGDLTELIAAVRNGQEIRIAWSSQRPDNPQIKVEHLADAKFLTIMSDEIVFAQIDPIIGQTPMFSEQWIQLKENLEWSFIAASNGKTDSMMRNVKTGEILAHNQRNRGIKWYIKEN